MEITTKQLTTTLAATLAFLTQTARADVFGSGSNTFAIDFVSIGNAGNGDDAGAGGGSFSGPFGGVAYTFRMGITEVPQDWVTKSVALGLSTVTSGPWLGNQPATNVSWLEAAAFVNFLNTSTGHQAAYNLNAGATEVSLWDAGSAWDNDPSAGLELNLYRHKNAYYFLPSEDEWYKAAYHNNDGTTANYWDYTTGSNTVPTAVVSGTAAGTAVFEGLTSTGPAPVGSSGGLSPYGTRGQGGNVFEWNESLLNDPDSVSAEDRTFRGGSWHFSPNFLRSSSRSGFDPTIATDNLGLRIASVPEPTGAALLLGWALTWTARRRRG